MSRGQRNTLSVGLLSTAALTIVACSGSDAATSAAVSSPTVPGATAVADADPIETPSSVMETVAPPTLPTIPDGVPGLDSDDRFCRAWSEFAGSFQALALASDVGTDPTMALRSELAASDAVTAAWTAMSDAMPAEIDPADAADFLDEMIGPFADRAQASRARLIAAGLSSQQVAELGSLWLATLVETGLGDPDIDVDVPADMRSAFDAALEEHQQAVPPIVADERLATAAQAPETMTYIADNCPDQGILGGIDDVE